MDRFGHNPLEHGLLYAVVASSLALLLFGLPSDPTVIEILQLPTTVTQALFVLAVMRRFGARAMGSSLTPLQLILVGLLMAYMVFSALHSPTPSALLFAPAWVMHVLFFVALNASLRDTPSLPQKGLFAALGITAILHVVAFLVAWVIWPETVTETVLPAFDNIRHLGYLLAPVGVAAATWYITQQSGPWPALISFAVCFFYLADTGSRGGAMALVAGLVLTLIYLSIMRCTIDRWRGLVILCIAVAVLVVCELVTAYPWPSIVGRSSMVAEQDIERLLNGRSAVWSTSVKAIQQNWLWGYGPAIMGQIPDYTGPPNRHPHNLILQFLLHWGLIGTALIVVTVSTYGRAIYAALVQRPQAATLPFAILVTMGVHALVDGGLYYPYSTAIAVIALAYLTSGHTGRETTV